MSAREPVLERRLRWLLIAVCALAAMLAVIGFLPGERVYDDSNNCFGYALASAFTMEHPQHGTCTVVYDKLVETRSAGGIGLVLGLAIALLPALAIRKPTRKRAWLWFALSPFSLAAGLFALLALAFHLDLFAHVEVLWPERVVDAGVVLFAALLLVVLPIMLLATPAPPPLPEARVVS